MAVARMTAPSPDELALLRLMAEVGVPLRTSLNGWYFPGHQMIRIPGEAEVPLTPLCSLGLLRARVAFGNCIDYVLTDKGREAAGGGTRN